MSRPSPLLSEIELRAGLQFSGHQQARMLSVIEADARRRGCADEVAHHRVLRGDQRAFADLLDRLVIHESYFFRDAAQMALVRDHVLRQHAAGSAPVAAWSAGCAAGEEAYTLAILGMEAGLGDRLRVLGSDLSAAAIERARTACYTSWSLRGVGADRLAAWFRPSGSGHVVTDAARAQVRFSVQNLLDDPPGTFDLVLCRNVLIYLTPSAIRRAASVLATALRPGGWLVTGASDPVLHAEGLARVQTPFGQAYRLIGDAGAPRHTPPSTIAQPPPSRPLRPADAPGRSAQDAPAVTVEAPARESPLRRLRALADAGRTRDAIEVLPSALAQDPLDPELRYLAAALHLDAGDAGSALREARAALYLDPGLSVAHLLLGHALRALGQAEASARSYQHAARSLAVGGDGDNAADGDLHSARHLSALAGHIAAESRPS